jgi:MraZ protein
MIFIGEYQVSFTAPGRIILPKKLRKLLEGNEFVLSQGFDNCLAGYDKKDWERRVQSLVDISPLEEEQLNKRRFVFASATYSEIDDQGRFVIPKNLLQYAQLTEEITIIGVGDHFEVWNTKLWMAYVSKSRR